MSNILVHLVFSTKNRAALILPTVEDELRRYLAAICKICNCHAH
ncbi:MAG: transposase [Planctomycetes bacterium]|nr:transposase [Planctomycetota bacterium]